MDIIIYALETICCNEISKRN